MSPFLRLSRPKARSRPYRVVRRTDRTIFTDHTPLPLVHIPKRSGGLPHAIHSPFVALDRGQTTRWLRYSSTLPSPTFLSLHCPPYGRRGCRPFMHPALLSQIGLTALMTQGYCMICRVCSLSALSYRSNPLAQSAHAMELYLYFPSGSNRGHRVSPPVPMASRVQIPNQGPPVS